MATTLDDIEVKKATVFSGVPTMWIALANTPDIDKRDFSSLRYAASGGAALPVEVAERFHKLTGHRLGGGWGMTETSPAGTALPRDCAHKPGSVGLPLPGILMDIVALDDPRRRLRARREGRDPHQGPERDQGLLERAGRRRRPPSSTAICSPATSATWTRTAISISSTARRT